MKVSTHKTTFQLATAALALVGVAAQADPLQVSTASGVKATLYGFVQLDGSWENQRGTPAPGNFTYYSQTGSTAHSGEWNWTADNSRFGVNLAGPDGEGLALGGKFEFDFYGGGSSENNPVPRLRHAYGTVAFPSVGLSFLAGQTWDLVAPLNVPTLNAGVLYQAGNLGSTRRPQFRVTETVALPGNGKWEVAAAVARTIGNATNAASSSDAGHDAGIPTFQGRTAVSLPLWVEKQFATLGFSGHYAKEDVLQSDNSYKSVASWSGAVELELPLVSFVSLAGEGFYGEDLATYNGGIGQGVVNGAPVEGFGGWAALRFKAGPVTANVGAGIDTVHASTVLAKTGRTSNSAVFGNVGYNLNAASKVAIEVERFETDYKAGATEDLWRTQVAYSYNF